MDNWVEHLSRSSVFLFFSVWAVHCRKRRAEQCLSHPGVKKSLVSTFLAVKTAFSVELCLLWFLLLPSGFYIVDFIQTHCFRVSVDTINSIYSLGAARGTLRLHSRELLFCCCLLVYLIQERHFWKKWNDIPHIIMWTKIFCAQIWTVVWLCSLLRYKNKPTWNLLLP